MWKKHTLLAILLILILTMSALLAGCGGANEEPPVEPQGGEQIEQPLDDAADEATGGETEAEDEVAGENQAQGDVAYSESQGMKIDEETGKDQFLTDPVPEGKPIPVEPQHAVITDKQLTCTLTITCQTILDNIDDLDPEKVELVPEDGVILAKKTVNFYEGENVFQLLRREAKANKIHMEFEDTPIYNSAYIEGIHNLYEFDCGELSGWMYKVNGWYPNYGCSRYQLMEVDDVEWIYTCDLGRDIGGRNVLE
ncbi:MAG: DUF4430 domain-containing protein [Firmicutes bacterium]|nr:DUF4430 domain-containing protein [Bacillota bacterium]